MKTALLYNTLFTLLLIPVLVIGSNNKNWKGKYTKEKKINKEYTVNPDATLKVDNSYGNIDIVTWSENQIVIEVTVTTNGNNEEKVQKKLDDIDIIFSGSVNSVSAKTRFNKSKSWWNWN